MPFTSVHCASHLFWSVFTHKIFRLQSDKGVSLSWFFTSRPYAPPVCGTYVPCGNSKLALRQFTGINKMVVY